MLVQLIHTALDSGRFGTRMGQGPGTILSAGAARRLAAAGHQVETIRVEPRSPFPTEIATAFEIARLLSRQVRMASRQRRFPVILAGNCMASLGAVAGLPRGRTGLVWLDAHADFHTPDTTRSGLLDGMALSILAGHCWRPLANTTPGFHPVAPEDILLLGARDIHEEERGRLLANQLRWQDVPAMRADPERVTEWIGSLGASTERVHLHVDLDVLDPDAVAPANGFAVPGGLTLPELVELIGRLRGCCRLGSATIASYDPAFDPEGRMCAAALEVLDTLTTP